MDTLLLAGLACTVALLLITIRYYERRVERLQDDLDFAVRLLAADADERLDGVA